MLEVDDFLVSVVSELESIPEADVVELAFVRAKVDSLKQDISLKAS